MSTALYYVKVGSKMPIVSVYSGSCVRTESPLVLGSCVNAPKFQIDSNGFVKTQGVSRCWNPTDASVKPAVGMTLDLSFSSCNAIRGRFDFTTQPPIDTTTPGNTCN